MLGALIRWFRYGVEQVGFWPMAGLVGLILLGILVLFILVGIGFAAGDARKRRKDMKNGTGAYKGVLFTIVLAALMEDFDRQIALGLRSGNDPDIRAEIEALARKAADLALYKDFSAYSLFDDYFSFLAGGEGSAMARAREYPDFDAAVRYTDDFMRSRLIVAPYCALLLNLEEGGTEIVDDAVFDLAVVLYGSPEQADLMINQGTENALGFFDLADHYVEQDRAGGGEAEADA